MKNLADKGADANNEDNDVVMTNTQYKCGWHHNTAQSIIRD